MVTVHDTDSEEPSHVPAAEAHELEEEARYCHPDAGVYFHVCPVVEHVIVRLVTPTLSDAVPFTVYVAETFPIEEGSVIVTSGAVRSVASPSPMNWHEAKRRETAAHAVIVFTVFSIKVLFILVSPSVTSTGNYRRMSCRRSACHTVSE